MTGSHMRRGAWCAAMLGMALAATAFSPNIGNFARPKSAGSTTSKISKKVSTPVKVSSTKAAAKVSSKPEPKATSTVAQIPNALVTVSGNISPKVIEIEEGASNHATKLGTNLYPRAQGGTDPVLNQAQFANDPLRTLLNFHSAALLNTPLLNVETQTYVDWVKDTLPNVDTASVVGSVATGIVPGVSGTTFQSVKRGHWNGARIIDGVAGNELDQFIQGGKEEDTSTWTIDSGSIGSSKYDATQAYIANTSFATADTTNFPTGQKNVLYFAMERRGNNGTTCFDFEFNQLPPINDYVPNRSAGDVLFTFEMNGSGSSGSAVPHVYVYANGNYLQNEVLAASLPAPRRAVSSINQTTTPSAPWGYVDSKGVWTIGQIPNFTVAEAAVPFGVDFLQGVNGCGGQAFVQIRTRSSVSVTSDLKDTTKFFVYSFGGPKADLQLQSNCNQSFDYSAAGSADSNGGGNLTYNWDFTVPAGVTLSSTDPELAIDNQNANHYTASFTSDSVRNISVGIPQADAYADIQVKLKVIEGGGCFDETDTYTVRVYKSVGGTATLTAPCSPNFEINYSSTATGGLAPYSYSWKFYKVGSPDTQVGTSSTASGTFNAPSAGDYYGVLEISDTAATSSDSHVIAKPVCKFTTNSNTVTTYPPLDASVTLTPECGSRKLTFGSTVTGGNGTYTYEWKLFKKGTPDTQVDSSSAASGSWTPAVDGIYYATLKVTEGSANACTDTAQSGDVGAYGPISVTPSLTAPCEGRGIGYSATVSGGKAPYTYAWKFYKVGSPDTQVGSSSATSGTFTPTEDGDYYATLEITDSNIIAPATVGCKQSGTSNTVTVAAPMNPVASKDSADGSLLTVTLKVVYHAPATVQWQKFVGGAWVDINGETGDTLTYSSFEADDPNPQPLNYSISGVNYKGKVWTVKFRAKTHRNLNGGCDAISNEVTVTKTIGVDP